MQSLSSSEEPWAGAAAIPPRWAEDGAGAGNRGLGLWADRRTDSAGSAGPGAPKSGRDSWSPFPCALPPPWDSQARGDRAALATGTESSAAHSRDTAKPPADGNGAWIQTSATEVRGSGLHYQPLESPCPPEICHAHFEPFHFYGQV